MPIEQNDNRGGSTKVGEGAERFGGFAQPPSISLPKGGGAIRGIGEKFAANPVTGTGRLTVPIATSPGRSGFGPQLSLSYDSGSGNGQFGFGWSLSLPSITRKTDKGLPRYRDAEESDVFILSGTEDLVPVLVEDCGQWERHSIDRAVDGAEYTVQRYRPRIEGLFARIERWTSKQTGEIHWRSISRDNITTLYGKRDDAKIADPADPLQVFSWLICESFDDKGNAILYEYQPEDAREVDWAQPQEKNRLLGPGFAQRYLKRIKYCNRTPHQRGEDLLLRTDWLFEVVFDYDEGHYETLPSVPEDHDYVYATLEGTRDWPVREDPFSSYRAGFEVRTYRLCRRVLMLHHFPDELGTPDYLVRSTEFTYAQNQIASFITHVTQSGYMREDDGRYLKKSFPPIELGYTRAVIDEAVRSLDAESLENLPVGLSEPSYQCADLDSEGVSGVVSEQANTWFYKRNLGAGTFGSLRSVAPKPSLSALGTGRQQLMDLAGDGELDLVDLNDPAPGFYEREAQGGWKRFVPFESELNVAWDNRNLRFVDLTGDGRPDVLISEETVFAWYPSLGEQGFGRGELVPKARDEEQGPTLVFASAAESIYLADLSGDGLTDLVRIRNGEVCYWPNLGYGRFGTKVTMANPPCFDAPDQFDQRRIRLGDIDGTGVTDIVYLGRDGIQLYFNQSGNGWSTLTLLKHVPPTDNLKSVTVVDLLGNGTACLVWSSPLPNDVREPIRYVDLMGGQKPHLLSRIENNLGAETRVHYAPSTKFYLADQEAGKPWITRLPFPVHVVERVETYDHISRNRFVTRYAYHHGFYDGVEREFRGFARVDQWDTESFAALTADGTLSEATNIDAASHVPPVLTKTWFHAGVHVGRDRISNYFAGLADANDKGEYYREPGLTDAEMRELLLPDTVLPAGLTPEEEREACRALKGSMLRQEVYALDGTDNAPHPYFVTEQNFTVRPVQRRHGLRHAVFVTHARETLNYHYERNPADPRVQHALTLEADDFGNVLKEAAVAYGRRRPDPSLPLDVDREKQARTLITYTENGVTNAIDGDNDYPHDYRSPLPCESRTYELTGLKPERGSARFSFDAWTRTGFSLVASATEIPYEQTADDVSVQKRLIEHDRTLYGKDDLTSLSPLGAVERLALPGESYKLAFTPGLLEHVFKRHGQSLLPNPAEVLGSRDADGGGYVVSQDLKSKGYFPDADPDAHWWVSAGRIFLSPESADAAARERAYAQNHFFLPHRYRNPFHTNTASTESLVSYDVYDLLMLDTVDAVGNRVTVGERRPNGDLDTSKPGNDYRVLQPARAMDQNRNRTEVAFDALGMVVGTTVMGKPEETLGDSLHKFNADLTETTALKHITNPLNNPHAVLGRATTRLVYDLAAYQRTKNVRDPRPPVIYTLARETHDADLKAGQVTKIQHGFSYSDGSGREIQKKLQAEPEKIHSIAGAPRWVGSGWTILNNKGNPVRQYEPFFSTTHGFEFNVRVGVSPILFYDPLGRAVATLNPNHTYEKVAFDSWRQETWDVNDTVLVADPKMDSEVAGFFRRLAKADYLPSWYALRHGGDLGEQEQAAASKTAMHAHTPTVAHFDSLGRPFLVVEHNRFNPDGADASTEECYCTRVNIDVEGRPQQVIDAKNRVITRSEYNVLGERISQANMDGGQRWILKDTVGNMIRAWDTRNHEFRSAYDLRRRPVKSFLRNDSTQKLLLEYILYGETAPNPENRNLRGRVVELSDQAGIVTTDDYDFKDNLLCMRRRFAQEYKATLDWSSAVPLEAGIYENRTRYDALNRPNALTAPDNSVVRLNYNEANLLLSVEANLRGEAVATPVVTNIDYDAKGQRKRIDYGNGVRTTHEYDPLTFRLVHLLTDRDTSFVRSRRDSNSKHQLGRRIQNIRYTYDAIGNITHITNNAQQAIFFNNRLVDPSNDYTYDALYRLIEATGRESLGRGAAPIPHSHDDLGRIGLPHPSDGNAMARYFESYVYDAVGNLLSMRHRAAVRTLSGWTREYDYEEPSPLDAGNVNNRLSSTRIGDTIERYSYDHAAGPHGNITAMPHLPLMKWDYRDQLRATARQVVSQDRTPEITWYIYDSAGQRVRKVTERQASETGEPTRKKERIYLEGFEMYRKFGSDGRALSLERETLHIIDGQQMIASIETRTDEKSQSLEQLIRYQFGDHLGSSTLETDHRGQIISYEEYTPYGSSSHQSVRSSAEAPKRYRYTGKERDEESGLSYHSARYCMLWIGRWISPDPIGLRGGLNSYSYSANNPIVHADRNGKQPELMRPWPYSNPVPDRSSLGNNVQRDHPIQVKARTVARTAPSGRAYYSRNISAAQGELTILAETGRGYFHTAVGRLQRLIRLDYVRGILKSEGELIYRTKLAYQQAAASTGAVYSAADLDLVLLSNQAAVHRTLAETAAEFATEIGPSTSDFPSNAAFESAFADPDPPAPSTSSSLVQSTGRFSRALRTAGSIGLGILGVIGSGLEGHHVGTGINDIREGNTAEGINKIVFGGTRLGVTLGGGKAVAAKRLAAGGGGLSLFLAGLAAVGSSIFAEEEIRRTIRGEATLAAEAKDYWADVQDRAVTREPASVSGALKYVAAEFAGGISGFLSRGQEDLWGLL